MEEEADDALRRSHDLEPPGPFGWMRAVAMKVPVVPTLMLDQPRPVRTGSGTRIDENCAVRGVMAVVMGACMELAPHMHREKIAPLIPCHNVLVGWMLQVVCWVLLRASSLEV